MSKKHDIAVLMRDAIKDLPELHACQVVVQRQKDIKTKFKVSMAKIGGCVLIHWGKGQNPDTQGPLQMDMSYTVEFVINEALWGDKTAPDDVTDALMATLDGWNPSPTEHCDYEAHVVSDEEPLESNGYSIYSITLSIRIDLK